MSFDKLFTGNGCSTSYEFLHLRVYNGAKPSSLEGYESYDIINMELVVQPVTMTSGGVTCTVRIAGKEGNGNSIEFPDYNDIISNVTVGKTASIVISGESTIGDNVLFSGEKVLITGVIANTARTEASYANTLRNSVDVVVGTEWDFLDSIPRTLLVTASEQHVNSLMAESLLFQNKAIMSSEFLAHIREKVIARSGDSSINVAKAVAAVLDYADIRSVAGKGKPIKNDTPFQSILDADDAPCLVIPKKFADSVFSQIADSCSTMIRKSVPNKNIILAMLQEFYMYLVPRRQKDDGSWKPRPIPDNVWGEENKEIRTLTRRDVVAVSQGVTLSANNKFSGVAVRFSKTSEDFTKGVDVLRAAVYTHLVNKDTGEIERVAGTTKSSDGVPQLVTKAGKTVKVDGSFILRDLPSWIQPVAPGATIKNDDWRVVWAELIAKAEFAKHNVTRQTMGVEISTGLLDEFINSVGEIIALDITASDEKHIDPSKKIYARVAGVRLNMSSALNYFRTSLTLTLQGVRSAKDQKALSISNNGLFSTK